MKTVGTAVEHVEGDPKEVGAEGHVVGKVEPSTRPGSVHACWSEGVVEVRAGREESRLQY